MLAWLLIAGCGGAPEIEAPVPGDQIAVDGAAIEWGACPPGLPDGCGMAVLEGDPTADKLFTLRIRTTKPFVLAPHHHPSNERVTVIDGALHVGFGDAVDKAASTRFDVGDYYVNKAGAHHFVWSDEPAVVQITGIGPWKVIPVEP